MTDASNDDDEWNIDVEDPWPTGMVDDDSTNQRSENC